MYQRVGYSLPTAGAELPGFWDVPPEPYRDNDKAAVAVFEKHADQLKKRIEGSLARDVPGVLIVDGGKGISSVAAEIHRSLCDDHTCLWIDTDDYQGPRTSLRTLSRP